MAALGYIDRPDADSEAETGRIDPDNPELNLQIRNSLFPAKKMGRGPDFFSEGAGLGTRKYSGHLEIARIYHRKSGKDEMVVKEALAAGGLKIMSDGKRVADRHNPKGYFEESRVKDLRRDNSWLPEARGHAVKIVAQLLPFLPNDTDMHYAVILMERDLDEVIASQNDLLKDSPAHRPNMPDNILKHTFSAQLRQSGGILGARKIPTLSICYQDILSNPLPKAARINGFLDARLDEAAMAGVVNPDLYRHKSAG